MTIILNDYEYVRKHVRQVPDFPKKGILFLDITTATKDAKAFEKSIDFLYEQFKDKKLTYVAGVESRGFIFGAALASKLGIGFIPIRKPNKLPADTIKETYDLEYGSDTIEMHKDAVKEGDRVVIIDDHKTLCKLYGSTLSVKSLIILNATSIINHKGMIN